MPANWAFLFVYEVRTAKNKSYFNNKKQQQQHSRNVEA